MFKFWIVKSLSGRKSLQTHALFANLSGTIFRRSGEPVSAVCIPGHHTAKNPLARIVTREPQSHLARPFPVPWGKYQSCLASSFARVSGSMEWRTKRRTVFSIDYARKSLACQYIAHNYSTPESVATRSGGLDDRYSAAQNSNPVCQSLKLNNPPAAFPKIQRLCLKLNNHPFYAIRLMWSDSLRLMSPFRWRLICPSRTDPRIIRVCPATFFVLRDSGYNRRVCEDRDRPPEPEGRLPSAMR